MTLPIPPEGDPLGDDDDALPPGFPSHSERNWAVFCHLGGFGFYLLPFAFGHIAVPLVIWLTKRNGSAFIEENGREALNFQITVTIYAIACGALAFLLIGLPLLVALAIFHFVLMVIASVHASQGDVYRYPFTLRLL